MNVLALAQSNSQPPSGWDTLLASVSSFWELHVCGCWPDSSRITFRPQESAAPPVAMLLCELKLHSSQRVNTSWKPWNVTRPKRMNKAIRRIRASLTARLLDCG